MEKVCCWIVVVPPAPSPSFIVSFSDSGLRDNGFLHCSRISFLHAVLEVAVRSHRLLLDLVLGGHLGCGFFS